MLKEQTLIEAMRIFRVKCSRHPTKILLGVVVSKVALLHHPASIQQTKPCLYQANLPQHVHHKF